MTIKTENEWELYIGVGLVERALCYQCNYDKMDRSKKNTH